MMPPYSGKPVRATIDSRIESFDTRFAGLRSRVEEGGIAVIESDYFVTGAGGTAMAFVDALLTESSDARIVMVDRHHGPGGHWNDAYPYVRLHQPSAWYGVASRELSDWSQLLAGAGAT
jgi:shikimate 5-dehydrogenase